MNEDIQRYHSSFLVQEFVNNSINEEEFFTAIDNIQEELEVFEKIVSSLKPLLLQAKDKISNEEKQNQILKIVEKLESGNFLKSYIGIIPSKVGEPTTYHEVPKQRLREFRGVFCDQILMVWERFGWSSFAKGLAWLVDPTIYDDIIKKLLKNTPYSEFDNYRVIARTAFGELILLGENTHTIVEIDLDSEGFSTLDHIRDLRLKADKALRLKMTSLATCFDKEYLDTVDSDGKELFKKALKKLGELQSDEMYAFDSELPPNTWIEGVKDYKKVNIVEYLTKLQEVSRLKYPQEEDKSMMEVRDGITPDSIVLPRSGEVYPYTFDSYIWNKTLDLDGFLKKTILNPLIMEDLLEIENRSFLKQGSPKDKEVLEKLLKKGEDTNSLTDQFRMNIYFHILRGGNIPQITTTDELGFLLSSYEETKKHPYDVHAMDISQLKVNLFFSHHANSDITNEYPLYLQNHKKLYQLDLVLQELISSNTLVENFTNTASYAQDNELCEYILGVFRILKYKIEKRDTQLFTALVSVLLQNEQYTKLILQEIEEKSKAFNRKYHENIIPTIKSIADLVNENSKPLDSTLSSQNIESNHSGNLDEILNKPELNHSMMEDILENEIQLFHKQQAPQQKEVLEKLLEKAKENYCLSPQFRQGIYFHILRGGNIPMVQTQDEFEALLGAYKELGNYSNYKEPSIIKQPLKTAFYFGENTDSDYPLSFINHTKLMALETGLSQLIASNLLVEHFILLADLSKDSKQCEYILEVFQGLDYKIQEEEFMLFMGLVSIVVQNEQHQQTLLKQIKGKAFDEKYHQDLATIISSGTNTSFSADSFSTIDSSSTSNNTPNTSIEIDEYFEFFLEKFGEPTQKIEATKEQIEKYRGVLPQKLLEYWEIVGFSGFKDGLFWITNPDEFTYTVENFLEDTPLEEYDKYHVIGRSAYGTLYLWGERTGDSLEIIPHLNWIKTKEGKEKDIKNGKEDMAIQRFFSVKNPKSVDVEDTNSNPLFPKVVQKYGALQKDEVLIFTPYLFFGGEASIDTVEKGNLDVFLSIFINMNQPEIVDMASMVQGVRKEYGE